MKKLLFVLFALLFLTQVKPLFAAGGICVEGQPCICEADPCVVIPYRDKQRTITIPAGREVILRWVWASCNYGKTLSFTKQVAPGITFDGQLLFSPNESGQYWKEPVLDSGIVGPGECINNSEYLWKSYWDYPLGILEPGIHKIDYVETFDHKMIDLFDFNEDGKPDVLEEGVLMANWIKLLAE